LEVVLDKDTLKMTEAAFCWLKMLVIKMMVKTKSLIFGVFIYGHLCTGKLWFAFHVFYHSAFTTVSKKKSFRLPTFNHVGFFSVNHVM
jgi:hypothetical protein